MQLQLRGHMNKQIYRLWGTSSYRIINEKPQNPHRAAEDFELAKCLECPRFLLVTLSQHDNGVAAVLGDVGLEDMRLLQLRRVRQSAKRPISHPFISRNGARSLLLSSFEKSLHLES